MKHDRYPKSITDAPDIMMNHKHDNHSNKNNHNNNNNNHNHNSRKKDHNNANTDDGVSAIMAATVAGAEQSFAQLSEGNCFCCGKKGHYSPVCPDKDEMSPAFARR